MIPKECKRLAEVDFPIAVVSRHSAREKSIAAGHPNSLHRWWARRPLAACRAMLLALLLPDPCDENCPAEFTEKARALLGGFPGIVLDKDDLSLRRAILHFIRDFANWDNAAHPRYLEVGRGLIKTVHGEETPLVVDPFAGGGSIPLEALRLGCDAFASDLNPVACLILKVMLEDIPRYGPELADDLRKAGAEIKKQAEKELANYYPPDPDGATPIAYLWARTVKCERPKREEDGTLVDPCGLEIPLMRSFWLCKKGGRSRALRYQVKRSGGKPSHLDFEVFVPKSEKEVPEGTVSRAKVTCPACGYVLAPDRVRAQLRGQRGGADSSFDASGNRVGGARLMAVVTLRDGKSGRQYRVGTERDYRPVWKARQHIESSAKEKLANGMSVFPDEPTPAGGGSGAGRAFSVQNYGMTQWGDLFTARQKLALTTLAEAVARTRPPFSHFLALSLGRIAEQLSVLVRWRTTVEAIAGTGRQALPMTWDFTEIAPVGDLSSNYGAALQWIVDAVDALAPAIRLAGQVQVADACEFPLPDDSCTAWFTDPPYYDAVPYADLSDFFYVWLKRALPNDSLTRERLTPKDPEIVQDETKCFDGRPKDRKFFEERMALAFAEGRHVLKDDGIGSVVFAHKTTEGWEALLSGMIKGGWTITGSWPVSTERPGRLRAQESAPLATSVHLICRPRPEDAVVGDWAEVFRELPNRIGDWIERLSSEGMRGADLVFACIGPAMEVFSRYSKVEDAEGREIPLDCKDPDSSDPYRRGFLSYVWEIVGRTALGQVLGTAEARARNGAAGALEEDARLTALFLWTHQSTATNGADNPQAEVGGDTPDDATDDDEEEDTAKAKSAKGLTLIFDVVRRFSQPLGIHLDTWEGRIVETKKGIVRLLPVKERAEHLLGEDGASGAADLIERSGGGPLQLSLPG